MGSVWENMGRGVIRWEGVIVAILFPLLLRWALRAACCCTHLHPPMGTARHGQHCCTHSTQMWLLLLSCWVFSGPRLGTLPPPSLFQLVIIMSGTLLIVSVLTICSLYFFQWSTCQQQKGYFSWINTCSNHPQLLLVSPLRSIQVTLSPLIFIYAGAVQFSTVSLINAQLKRLAHGLPP